MQSLFPMRQVTKLSPANAGVIYINLTAWQELHSDLMRYAELNGWIFPNADQARPQRRCFACKACCSPEAPTSLECQMAGSKPTPACMAC